jgi:ADP-ribose pyrophosphatase YjhB (NUDIX family)
VTVDARYCPRCATPLAARPPVQCAFCGYELFVNARPTSSVVVLSDRRFLALRRAIEPGRGMWEVPGGFCDGWEHPEHAAVREAREELGVDVSLRDFIGMYIGTYEFQGEKLPVLDCFWTAHIVEGEVRIDPHESSEYDWLPIDDPPPLAFNTMDSAIRDLAGRV